MDGIAADFNFNLSPPPFFSLIVICLVISQTKKIRIFENWTQRIKIEFSFADPRQDFLWETSFHFPQTIRWKQYFLNAFAPVDATSFLEKCANMFRSWMAILVLTCRIKFYRWNNNKPRVHTISNLCTHLRTWNIFIGIFFAPPFLFSLEFSLSRFHINSSPHINFP